MQAGIVSYITIFSAVVVVVVMNNYHKAKYAAPVKQAKQRGVDLLSE